MIARPISTADLGGTHGPRPRGVVFASYNGLLDPLGPTQILPYLERLRSAWPIHILSFERPDRLADTGALENMETRLRAHGIRWTCLRYHKWPSLPATTFDLGMGIRSLRSILRGEDIGLIHARGYLPMEIATRATSRIPILFDIRGLQAEEYVDGGVWRQGELKWLLAKLAERRFFRKAAGAVVLTQNIRPYVAEQFALIGRSPTLDVIPCCVDLERFRFDADSRRRRRRELGVDDATTLFVYSGSIGTWYMPDDMARLVRTFGDHMRRPVCLLWMVNNDESRARSASEMARLSTEEFRILRAQSDEVPGYLSAADVALALIRPSFSKRSSSPTKYAESLAVGLPLVLCSDVGDGADLVERGVAVALDDDLQRTSGMLATLLEQPRSHFRHVATELFDIEHVAIPAYRAAYERLAMP